MMMNTIENSKDLVTKMLLPLRVYDKLKIQSRGTMGESKILVGNANGLRFKVIFSPFKKPFNNNSILIYSHYTSKKIPRSLQYHTPIF